MRKHLSGSSVSGITASSWGRIRSAGQAEASILPEVLDWPDDPPPVRPYGGILFLLPFSETAMIFAVCYAGEIFVLLDEGRIWLGACDDTSSGTPLLPSHVAPLQGDAPASRSITKFDRQPFRLSRVPSDSRNDTTTKKKVTTI